MAAWLTAVTLQDEAFQLWTTEWASLYEKDSKSQKVLALTLVCLPCACQTCLKLVRGKRSPTMDCK